MLIRIVYNDDRHDMVKPFVLDYLITNQKIKSFRRSDGWAIIGASKIRNITRDGARPPYLGFERRAINDSPRARERGD